MLGPPVSSSMLSRAEMKRGPVGCVYKQTLAAGQLNRRSRWQYLSIYLESYIISGSDTLRFPGGGNDRLEGVKSFPCGRAFLSPASISSLALDRPATFSRRPSGKWATRAQPRPLPIAHVPALRPPTFLRASTHVALPARSRARCRIFGSRTPPQMRGGPSSTRAHAEKFELEERKIDWRPAFRVRRCDPLAGRRHADLLQEAAAASLVAVRRLLRRPPHPGR